MQNPYHVVFLNIPDAPASPGHKKLGALGGVVVSAGQTRSVTDTAHAMPDQISPDDTHAPIFHHIDAIKTKRVLNCINSPYAGVKTHRSAYDHG